MKEGAFLFRAPRHQRPRRRRVVYTLEDVAEEDLSLSDASTWSGRAGRGQAGLWSCRTGVVDDNGSEMPLTTTLKK
jgi:hypothetical protein